MSIIQKIGRWICGCAIVATLIVPSCKEDDNSITPKNNSPTATIIVNPSSGTSPMDARIQASATDPDGLQDIASFRMVMKNSANSDSLFFTNNPLDTTLTLTCPPGFESINYNFRTEVKDKTGASDFKSANVVVNKKPNEAPNVNLNVSPSSGRAPLNTRIQASATDPDGLQDITNYGVVVQYNDGRKDTLKQNPLDTLIKFYNSASISAYVKDKAGLQDKKGPINVNVQRAGFTQTAALENLTNIKYEAVFTELDSAKLEIKKNNNTIISKTIKPADGQNYSEVFSWQKDTSITKGDYDFIAAWKTAEGNDTSITSKIAIPNYLPSLSFSGLQTNMNEEDTTNINLESNLANADTNPEDNPVSMKSVASLDGKTQVNIEGKELRIIALGDNTGLYQVQVEYGSQEGGTNQGILQGQIYDLPRIQGRLESNETRLGVQGTVKAYQISGSDTINLATKTSDSQGNNLTDANGNFDFKIKKRSNQLESILLMARQGTPGNYQGWVRAINLPKGDNSNVLMRVVPYGDYAGNPEEFKQFFAELVGRTPPNRRFDFDGEWLRGLPGFGNFKGLEKIRILDHGYFVDSLSNFTPSQQNNIKNKILDPNDISGIIGFYNIEPSKIVFGNDSTFTDYIARARTPPDPDEGSWEIIPRQGVIVVTPKTDMPSVGKAASYSEGLSLVSRGTIYMNGGGSNAVISHEFGHMFIGSGHPQTLPNQTVMSYSTNLFTTGPADKKAGRIIYEPTYKTLLSGEDYPSLDYINNILRKDFK